MLLAVVPGSLFEVQCSLLTCWPYVHWAHLCTALITALRVSKFGPYEGSELPSTPVHGLLKGLLLYALHCEIFQQIPGVPSVSARL